MEDGGSEERVRLELELASASHGAGPERLVYKAESIDHLCPLFFISPTHSTSTNIILSDLIDLSSCL